MFHATPPPPPLVQAPPAALVSTVAYRPRTPRQTRFTCAELNAIRHALELERVPCPDPAPVKRHRPRSSSWRLPTWTAVVVSFHRWPR